MLIIRIAKDGISVSTDSKPVTTTDILNAIELLEGKVMSNIEELKTVITDLTTVVDEQSVVVDNVEAKLTELENTQSEGGDVTPLIAELREQVSELKGNTERLSSVVPSPDDITPPEPAPAPEPAPEEPSPEEGGEEEGGSEPPPDPTADPTTDDSGNIVDPTTTGGTEVTDVATTDGPLSQIVRGPEAK